MEKPVFPGVRHFRDGQPKAGYFSKNPPPRPSLYYLTHFKPISQRRKFDLGHLRHFLWFYWIRAKIQYRGTKWGHGCLKFHFLTALAWDKASKQPLSLWILEFWPLFCWVSPFLRLWILPEAFPWPCILKVTGNWPFSVSWITADTPQAQASGAQRPFEPQIRAYHGHEQKPRPIIPCGNGHKPCFLDFFQHFINENIVKHFLWDWR